MNMSYLYFITKTFRLFSSEHFKISLWLWSLSFTIHCSVLSSFVLHRKMFIAYWDFILFLFFFFLWRVDPIPGHDLPFRGFEITLTGYITLGSTSLDEWSAQRRDLCLTTHSTHKRQTSTPPAGFEPTIPASEWPHGQALDRPATGIDLAFYYLFLMKYEVLCTY